MAKGKVSRKSKADEDTPEEASKGEAAGPPSKKSKASADDAASGSKKLVKVTIEHCTS